MEQTLGKIMVTGGCGYIGSHTIVDLLQRGFEVFSVDSLLNASEDVLDGIEKITGKRIVNYRIDVSEGEALKDCLAAEGPISGIIHFAALKAVAESVEMPLRYYHNNLNSLMQVLESMDSSDIPYLIFSSSCTVYGEHCPLPVDEDASFGYTASPYGKTKQMGEYIMQDVLPSIGKKGISLRYFNPAGAHPSSLIGEAPSNPALNLVPVITETAIGIRNSMMVFGTDYPTRDGSCVRDYVHVMDLARAHTMAIERLLAGRQEAAFDAFNLGIGKGLTVLEIIQAFEKVSGMKLNYRLGSRRAGDMAEIYANSDKARNILQWIPEYDVEDIMRTAWAWEKARRAHDTPNAD